MRVQVNECVLSVDGDARGLRIGEVLSSFVGLHEGGWPPIILFDDAGNKAYYSLGFKNHEKDEIKKKMTLLESKVTTAEQVAEEARRGCVDAHFALASERKKTAAEIERNNWLLAHIDELLKSEADAESTAKAWRAKSNYRDKRIAELRDALDQERSKPLILLVRERAAIGFNRLIAAWRGST